MTTEVQHRAAVREGVRFEAFTIAWMAMEAAIAIGAGIVARSVLLTAFGLDSAIELISGAPRCCGGSPPRLVAQI